MKHLVVVALVLGGCVASAELADPTDPGGDDSGSAAAQSCDYDPMYGDGTCQLDLTCGIADIDCFTVYPSDDAARAYLSSLGHLTVPITDPSYARGRMLVDRAWALFRADVPVGQLVDERLSVVIIDAASANAFVTSAETPGMVAWSVQIHRGLLQSTFSDDAVVSVLLHEIAHAVRQHVIEEVAARLVRFYTTGSPELIGFQQTDQPAERAFVEQWEDVAQLGGQYSEEWLGGLPYDNGLGSLFSQFVSTATYTQSGCSAALSTLREIRLRIVPRRLDGSITLSSADQLSLLSQLETLRSCATNPGMSFRTLVQSLGSEWVQYLGEVMLPAETSLWDGRALDALLTLAANRRATMRQIESRFAASRQAPWSSLRFFSREEEADDYAARIASRHGIPPADRESLFNAVLGTDQPLCAGLLAAGQSVPYGRNLFDDHHGTCWRIAHGRQIAAMPPASSRSRVETPVPWTPTRAQVPRPIY